MSCCGGKPSKKRQKPMMRKYKPKMALKAQRLALKTFLMCRPSFYGILYEINPWMQFNNPVNNTKAVEQWFNLCDRIQEHGGEIRFLKERPELPDLVFTANGGLVINKGKKIIILSHFKHKERKGEEEWFAQWFGDDGFQFYYPSVPFEGAGDALYLGETLVCGQGFRSDEKITNEIGLMAGGKYISVRLVDPHFYHLDTCFCPLDGSDYLIHNGAFDAAGQEAIRGLGGREISVPLNEAKRFACNSICIGKTVIIPSGCPVTTQLLEQAGYLVAPVEMSEFIKSGGACKCLTLEIA